LNKGLQKVYSEIPKRYELVNHLITFGTDIYCRRKAADIAAADGGSAWLDICCGTGEMAVNLTKRAGNGTAIFAADFSKPMIEIARNKPRTKNINFLLVNAAELPFPDNFFDLITISFATRNLNTTRDILIRTFSEFRRVLKPGGRFINLETSQPTNKIIKKLVHTYVSLTVRQLGTALTGSKAGYAYLANSIPRFYEADELAKILREAGFDKIDYKRLFFGAMAIHKAKLSL